MPSTVRLMVLVTNGWEQYKHWGLFIDDSDNPQVGDNFLRIKGPLGSQWCESDKIVFRNLPHLCDYAYICDVNVEDLDEIRHIAKKVLIHNEIPHWNSQDYVIALLDYLEARGLVDGTDGHYMRQKRVVHRMQERKNWTVW